MGILNEYLRIRENIDSSLEILELNGALINDRTSNTLPEYIKSLKCPLNLRLFTKANHCDEHGIWHKPDEWDDIESMPYIYEEDGGDVVWLLVQLKDVEHPIVALTAGWDGGFYVSYGRIYTPGVYTPIIEEFNTSTANDLTFDFTEYLALHDYIVIRVRATRYLRRVRPRNTSAGVAIPTDSYNTPILMRYGSMRNGDSLLILSTYLESDNIIDFAAVLYGTVTTVSCESAYHTDVNLQRVRMTGWNLKNREVSSFNSMFYNCISLSDFGTNTLDMTDWVTSTTSSVGQMFCRMGSFRGDIIARNWDFTGITSIQHIFSCLGAKRIIGMDTWRNGQNITNISYMSHINLNILEYDFSHLGLLNVTNSEFAFYLNNNLRKVNFNNCNLSRVTSMANMFNGCTNIQELIWDTNFTPPNTGELTSFVNFHTFYSLENITFDGWNFSNVTNFFSSTTGGVFKKMEFVNCIPPLVTQSTTSFLNQLWQTTYLDIGFLDFTYFTASGAGAFTELRVIEDFYPPLHIKVAFSMSNSGNLSHDSIIRILNNLEPLPSGTSLTCTIGSVNLSKLTDAEKKIATDKGWTLA